MSMSFHASSPESSLLTLCIRMGFPIHVNTISMGFPILHFKGSQVKVSKLLLTISVTEGCFSLSKQCRP